MSPRKKTIVCACLHVTEDEVMEAIRERKLRSLQDVTHYTEAGGGCTSCHPLIRQYLTHFSARLPNCSDK